MVSLEMARELVERSRPRSLLATGQGVVLLVIGLLLGATLANPALLSRDALTQLAITQGLLASLILWFWMRGRRHQRLTAMATSAWESVRLKDWPAAEQKLTRVLRGPVQPATLRVNSLMALAAVAEGQRQYEAVQHVVESVLRAPGLSPGQRYAARIALAWAMLRLNQLTDAVSMIDKLGRENVPEPLRAHVELLSLHRSVLMGQPEEAIAQAEERRALFRRHLGTHAGYGYGLLAAAFDRLGHADRAAELWRDATALIRVDELLERFSELQGVAARHPAQEWPL